MCVLWSTDYKCLIIMMMVMMMMMMLTTKTRLMIQELLSKLLDTGEVTFIIVIICFCLRCQTFGEGMSTDST